MEQTPENRVDLRTPAVAVVDLDAIARNYELLRQRVGPARALYAVVKADAYGHGAAAVARRLSREGADRFAVANTDEGVSLRRAGVSGEILVLSHAEPPDLPRQRAYGLTPALYDRGQAEALVAASGGRPLSVHLELDTGMGRAGIRLEDLEGVIALLRRSPTVTLAGTFANLSSADDAASPATARQVAAMKAGVERLRAAGISPGLIHVANSAGVLAHPDSWFDAVRPGLALYGISPSEAFGDARLEPALSVETRVVAVRRVPAGTPLGYGGRFITQRDTAIAVLPIGYHDGMRRSFSGRVAFLAHGRRLPVVGAVSMDLTLVDATGEEIERGDRVVCLGRNGGEAVTAWDLARAAGTIPYEILCGIGPRVARMHREKGPRAC